MDKQTFPFKLLPFGFCWYWRKVPPPDYYSAMNVRFGARRIFWRLFRYSWSRPIP